MHDNTYLFFSPMVLRTVKARELVFCSQKPYQLVSANYMLVNIISCTRAPYLPYTLHRESRAIGRVNKEAVCRSTKQPHEGRPRVSVKFTKVSEPPDNLLERANRERLQYRCFRWGIKRQLWIVERKVLNNRLKLIITN